MSGLQLHESRTGRQRLGPAAKKILLGLFYLIFIGSVSRHLYTNPFYAMDSIGYMGNAQLIRDNNLLRVHAKVYAEVERRVPQPAREHLLGRYPGAPADQNASRQLRAKDPYRFAEFLPFYAIRPLYNRVLLGVSEAGLGLVRATAFISAASYFFLGLLLMAWMQKYVALPWAVAMASLVMISPPVMTLGRETTADALATAVAFSALYLLFEKRWLMAGLIVLLASVYFRTDFAVLAGPALLVCWREKRLKLWQAALLGVVAAASVLSINYFAGDYGIKMLYYRNFIGTPLAPGEMTARFSVRDYISGFRFGVGLMAGSFFLPFLLAGVTGLFSPKRVRAVVGVTLAYAALHFLVLPNWEERWFCVFYLAMGLSAAAAFERGPREKLLPQPVTESAVAGAA